MGRSAAYKEPPVGDKTWDDFIRCEIENGDKHRVEPKSWPPQRLGRSTEEPSMSLKCVRCGTNVIAYAKHATGQLAGVEVIVPKSK